MKKSTFFSLAVLLAGFLPATAQPSQQAYDAAPKAHKAVVQPRQTAKMLPARKGSARKAVSPAQFQGLTLYANLTNSNDWAGLGIASVPYGVYSYTISEDLDFQPVSTDLGFNFMAAGMARTELVGVRPMELFGYLNGVEYNGLDSLNFKEQWSAVYTADNGGVDYSFIPSVMAYDVTSDVLYSVQYNADLSGLNWARWNPATRRFDVLHKWNNDFQPLAMGGTPDGRLFVVGSDGYFYELDKATADASMLGQLGIEPTLYVQSMAYEPQSGCFVWMAVSQSGSGLYALNPEDGATTLIRQLSKNEQAAAVFFKGNAAPAKAPGKAADLKFAYAGNGQTTGNITFTVPTTAYDGTALSGQVEMSVWLDGQALAEQVEVTHGQAQTFAFDLTNGNHYVDVVFKNAAGFSPNNYLYEYAGYDVPLSVGQPQLTVTDGVSTLSWQAPAGGVNGGYIDYDNLTYNVIRMPEGVTVAQQQKATTFTETLPTKMERYYYAVVPFNGAGKQGEAAESNHVLAGSAFQPPYFDDFTDESTLSLWTVINVDDDHSNWGSDYTWQYQSWGADWNLSTGSYAVGEGLDGVNDYLVSPGVQIEQGITYALTVSMRNTFARAPERVSLLVGTDPTDVSTFRVLASDEAYDPMSDGGGTEGRPWEADFQVEQSGTYYFAVRGYTKIADDGSGIFVYSLGVDELGVNDAPAEATALTVTPEATGELQAEVSFTVPTLTLGGSALTGELTATILRDGVLAATLSVQPGEQVTWTDENVGTVGVHVYTVQLANAAGSGKKAEASAFVGVFTTPFTRSFDEASDADFFVTDNPYEDPAYPSHWSWSQYSQNLALSYSAKLAEENVWLYLPALKLDADQVYEYSFKWSNSFYASGDNQLEAYATVGLKAEAEAQTMLGDLPVTSYGANLPMSFEVVTAEAGKHYLGVRLRALVDQASSYPMLFLSPSIDDISVTHVASAFAPYSVENLVAEHDPTGALKVTLAFEAPATDFGQRPLSGDLTVSIYRQGQTIPLKTFEGVQPGEQVQWTDEQPLRGSNSYVVVASNSYGRGKAATAEAFAGVDVPQAVASLRIRGNEDNQKAVIEWEAAPAVGQNGGVVDGSLVYTVVEYFPNETEQEKQLSVLAETTDLSYTVDREPTTQMEQHFYAVITQTSAGVGQAVIDYVILGQLKSVPFAESFANGSLSTDGWVANGDVTSYGAAWQMVQDSDEQTAQDGDNGFALCYNGNYYSALHWGELITPKMKLDAEKPYVLSFYVYTGAASSQTVKPVLVVSQSADDDAPLQLGDTISVSEGDAAWTKVELDLNPTDNYTKLIFRGLLSQMAERIWIDNIVVQEGVSTGLAARSAAADVVRAAHRGISVVGFAGQQVAVYAVDGRLVERFVASGNELRGVRPGVYLVNVAGATYKLTVE